MKAQAKQKKKKKRKNKRQNKSDNQRCNSTDNAARNKRLTRAASRASQVTEWRSGVAQVNHGPGNVSWGKNVGALRHCSTLIVALLLFFLKHLGVVLAVKKKG